MKFNSRQLIAGSNCVYKFLCACITDAVVDLLFSLSITGKKGLNVYIKN